MFVLRRILLASLAIKARSNCTSLINTKNNIFFYIVVFETKQRDIKQREMNLLFGIVSGTKDGGPYKELTRERENIPTRMFVLPSSMAFS